MERILELARKVAEEAEVFSSSTEETQVRFESNRLKQLQTNQRTSVALRIVKNGRIGYATASGEVDPQELVNAAVETAEFGMEAKFAFPGETVFPAVDIYDAAVGEVPIKDMVELGTGLIDTVVKHTPVILCEAGVGRGTVTVQLVNTRGGKAEYKKSFFGMDLEGNVIEGTDMLFVGESDSSCHPLTDISKVTGPVLRQLDLARKRAKAPTRALPVIFTPNGVTSLMMPLMSAFNGKTVLEGASPLGDKVGSPMFDPQFTLVDNPLNAWQTGSRPCDDEGVASRSTPLVEKGIVKGFLYDLQTAARAGTQSTGSGNRGGGSLPAPSASSLMVTPGTMSFADMVKDIKEGLVVEQLMGAGQGNVLGGDFSGNVLLGFKIENGEIVGRVKDTIVAGNVYRILKDIAAIGSEPEWLGGFLSTPHLYCTGISVSSKE
jgi:PmbA protein